MGKEIWIVIVILHMIWAYPTLLEERLNSEHCITAVVDYICKIAKLIFLRSLWKKKLTESNFMAFWTKMFSPSLALRFLAKNGVAFS